MGADVRLVTAGFGIGFKASSEQALADVARRRRQALRDSGGRLGPSARRPWKTRRSGAVRRLPVGPEVPHLDRAFVEKCLDDDLHRLRLIPPASLTLDNKDVVAA